MIQPRGSRVQGLMYATEPLRGPVRASLARLSLGESAVPNPMAEADEDLLDRVGQGDCGAFGTLFGRYAPKVKAYLLRLGAAGAVAEDVAQDAMVAVWRRAAAYDRLKAKASTWIFVIARNSWIDRLRREKVELAYRSVSYVSEESTEEAPDNAAARTQAEDHVDAALQSLSEEQRKVVHLSFFEDLPHAAIANRLSLPLGTVKSRLRLALAKLRAHWEQYS